MGLAMGWPATEMPNSVSVPITRRTLMRGAYVGRALEVGSEAPPACHHHPQEEEDGDDDHDDDEDLPHGCSVRVDLHRSYPVCAEVNR